MTIMINPNVCLVSAASSGSKNCQPGLEKTAKELEKILAENPPRQGEEAHEDVLISWRSRVADKAKHLADKVIACRRLEVPEREKFLNQAFNAILSTAGQESYIPTRDQAAKDILYVAGKMVKAKVPAKSIGWAVDRADDIVISLRTEKERDAKAGFENYMWGSVDIDSLTDQIRQIREKVGYLNLLPGPIEPCQQ